MRTIVWKSYDIRVKFIESMSNPLHLKDLFVGKTDAKNELSQNSKEQQDRFIDSFLIPENITLSEFFLGTRFFITGLKGTGKTALLRYIGLQAERTENAQTSLFLFKSDFTEEDKSAFSQAAHAFLVEKNPNSDFDDDYSNVWRWFLHRHIVKMVAGNPSLYFQFDKHWERYSKCVLAPKMGDEKSGIFRLFPKLKKGTVEIEGDLEFVKGTLGLDFEWENQGEKQVKFTNIVRQADELFQQLIPSGKKLYIFLDELEIALGKGKQYQKDIRLVRDLILAANKLNGIARALKFPIFIIAAIRSEVLTAMEATGKEINKPILDFGITLKWHTSGSTTKDHPLIRIISNKIIATEKALGLPVSAEDQVWKTYFVSQISTTPIMEYILHRTWYRPRDIVRLLAIAQQQFPMETRFTQSMFESINKEYSTQSWIEHTEELRTAFNESEVNGIRKLLISLKCPFTLSQMAAVASEKSINYSEVKLLLDNHLLGDILSHLYDVGIIGNTGEKVRYSFRGDDGLVLENQMKIHDPLWPYLATEKRF